MTASLVLAASTVHGAATSYTDEAAFVAALASSGHSNLVESFEDDAAWGLARTTIAGGNNTLSSIANLGVTWQPNNANGGVTTGNGPSRTGAWGLFQLPHGDYSDPAVPIGDGFVATTAAPIVGVGGWFTAHGASGRVNFVLDDTVMVGFDAPPLTSQHQFLGVIDPLGFQRLEVVETEGTLADQNFIFVDDVTVGYPASSVGTCGNGVVELDEQCDDGNLSAGDCCASDCTFETGSCDDGDACTQADLCVSGVCAGVAINCNDGDVCTADSCSSGVCGHVAVCPEAAVMLSLPAGQPLPDSTVQGEILIDVGTAALGSYTLTLTCDPTVLEIVGSVLGGNTTEFAGPPFQNQVGPCTVNLSALNFASLSGPVGVVSVARVNFHVLASVPGGTTTTIDTATSGLGTTNGQNMTAVDHGASLTVASPPASVCGDGILDFDEQCDDGNSILGDCCAADCTFEVTACDDGDACTGADVCNRGVCSGSAVDCNDGNLCTDDSCDPASGCAHTNNTASCDDGSACTGADVCNGGVCSGSAVDCNDGNLCTDDSCNPASGCAHTNNTVSCDDGSACTGADVCSGGVCSGSAVDCNDGNLCTDDSCIPASGCVSANNTASCDDGDACTAGDTCSSGACVGGPVLVCDDGNVCTDDSCSPVVGCSFLGNTAACDDGNACTANDACVGGACVGGMPLSCDDANDCTTDTCDAALGCVFSNNTGACDDGDACTSGDVCSGGSCLSGGVLDCGDGNSCTDDSCDPASGCVNSNTTATCDDGDACTSGDVCSGGSCVSGGSLNCDDGNACTDDSCDSISGCVNANNTAPCDDGDACTTNDSCRAGICSGEPLAGCGTTSTTSTTSPSVTTTSTTTLRVTTTSTTTTTLSVTTTTALPTTSTSTTSTSTTSTTMLRPYACGDVTGDGRITASDALAVLRASVGLFACDLSVCDVDVSGAITTADALAILWKAIGRPIEIYCGGPTTTTTTTLKWMYAPTIEIWGE